MYTRLRLQRGGANVDKLWAQFMTDPQFVARLGCDRSAQGMEDVKEIFVASDPTSNKKYLRWILETYKKGYNHLLEDVRTHMARALHIG